jgi:CheY-like chemotaxis protein
MDTTSANPSKADSVQSLPTKETILVVDDQPALCEVAKILLSRCGYCVLTAYEASQAKEIVRHNPNIDLLLTEIEIPGMLGDELAEWVRANRPHAAVVFMSGHPVQQRRLAGYPFIEKPFVHLDTLVATVREAIHPAHTAQQATPAAA